MSVFLACLVGLLVALVPVPSQAQRVQRAVTTVAVSPSAEGVGPASAAFRQSTATPAGPTPKLRPSPARYAFVGAISGLAVSTALLIGIGYTYGNGGLPPVYVCGVMTAGGLAVGAAGGIAVYGITRLVRR